MCAGRTMNGAQPRAAQPRRLKGPTEDDIDRTPVSMPIGYEMPTPLQDKIARMVREELERQTGDSFGSYDEEDDFDEEDADLLDMSKYEFVEIQEHYVKEDTPEAPETPSEDPQEEIKEDPTGDHSEGELKL